MFKFKSNANNFHKFKSESNDAHSFSKRVNDFKSFCVKSLEATLVKRMDIKVTALNNFNAKLFIVGKLRVNAIARNIGIIFNTLICKFSVKDRVESKERFHAKLLMKLRVYKNSHSSDSKLKVGRGRRHNISELTNSRIGEIRSYVRVKFSFKEDRSAKELVNNSILSRFHARNESTGESSMRVYRFKPKKLASYEQTKLADLSPKLKHLCFNLANESWKDVGTSYKSWAEVKTNVGSWEDLI